MHTDEYEISLGREIALCRKMLRKLQDALNRRERQYGMTTAAFLQSLDGNLLFPFPHTRLWEFLQREGRLREDRLLDDSQDLDIFCRPLAYRPTRPESEILQEYLDLWERLYNRSTFLDRTYRFCLASGSNPDYFPTNTGWRFSLKA